MLVLDHVVKDFGGLRAVNGVSFTLREHAITGLIGPNGAGKTTLFNLIAGTFPPTSGTVTFLGEPIQGRPPYRVFEAGLVRTFQIPKPFPEMTVLENVMLVPRRQVGERFWNNWVRRPTVARQERQVLDRARGVLAFVGLERLRQEYAKNLSGGQQKLLEIARAMMADPKLILLDEPGAGVNPTLLGDIMDKIEELHERGISFLVIEHNMDLVMALCDPVLVMAQGSLLMQGTPDEVRNDRTVLEAYLGGVPT